jgi:DNA-binding CsgD family transcriptional regulator/PAS domain-containing protein
MRLYSHEDLTKLTNLIYEAALAPDNWSRFLNELATAVCGHDVSLSLVTDSRLDLVAIAQSDPEFATQYEQHYWKVDPWVAAAKHRRELRPGLLDLGEKFVPPEQLKKSEFHNDFGSRFHFIGGIATLFAIENGVVALSLSQYSFGQFGKGELELVRAMVPHLARAMQIRDRLRDAQMMAADLSSALDCVRHGVLLVSAGGQALFANRVAQDILRRRDGLMLSRGELRAATPTETNILRAALFSTIQSKGADPGKGTILLSKENGRPLTVVIAPFPAKPSGIASDAAAVIFITDPDRTPVPGAESIALLLDLTPAEATLVHHLASGYSLHEAAQRLGIQRESARKRLKVIFHKTNTHRQADLIRLVLTTMGM